jgi:hypothetical protein
MKATDFNYAGNNMGNVVLDDGSIVALTDQAEPTSRCLPQPYDSGEEWAAPANYKGEDATVYFYFDEDDITDEDGEDLDPEDYPWDADHILCITGEDYMEIVPSWM